MRQNAYKLLFSDVQIIFNFIVGLRLIFASFVVGGSGLPFELAFGTFVGEISLGENVALFVNILFLALQIGLVFAVLPAILPVLLGLLHLSGNAEADLLFDLKLEKKSYFKAYF